MYHETMHDRPHNLLVILGPTASGKTTLGVRLAHPHRGEIVSADSRQVYKGLDIGSGKDLCEYQIDGVTIPHHLIDIANLCDEFSLFDYQRACFNVIKSLWQRNTLPLLVGGTGLYIESIVNAYAMVEAPKNPGLRHELDALSHDELVARLESIKQPLHNTTDLEQRSRLVRAIEIAQFAARNEPQTAPGIRPLILGTRWSRPSLHKRIAQRLQNRLDEGLIGEVEGLLRQGVPEEKLHALGLEYRYVNDFLAGRINNRNDLLQKLDAAIRKFAKRQDTWFRRMERNGTIIHWIKEANFEEALAITSNHFETPLTHPDAKPPLP